MLNTQGVALRMEYQDCKAPTDACDKQRNGCSESWTETHKRRLMKGTFFICVKDESEVFPALVIRAPSGKDAWFRGRVRRPESSQDAMICV